MATENQQQDEFKSVKQRLSAIQLVIKKDFKDGRLPQMDDVHRFIETSREMDRLCRSQWRASMDSYIDRLESFEKAMDSGELQTIEDAFHELIDRKETCHKEFRQR